MADERPPASPSNWIKITSKDCCSSGGTTSHTVILARSFNIPTLVGVDIDALTPWAGNKRFISTATPGRLWLSQGKP
ncbi:PEP-utilizing enzyme [Escherichia coli]